MIKPETRMENFLGMIADNPEAEDLVPKTRIEHFLAKAAGNPAAKDLTPQVRIEHFLDDIASKGNTEFKTIDLEVVYDGSDQVPGITVYYHDLSDNGYLVRTNTMVTKSVKTVKVAVNLNESGEAAGIADTLRVTGAKAAYFDATNCEASASRTTYASTALFLFDISSNGTDTVPRITWHDA